MKTFSKIFATSLLVLGTIAQADVEVPSCWSGNVAKGQYIVGFDELATPMEVERFIETVDANEYLEHFSRPLITETYKFLFVSGKSGVERNLVEENMAEIFHADSLVKFIECNGIFHPTPRMGAGN